MDIFCYVFHSHTEDNEMLYQRNYFDTVKTCAIEFECSAYFAQTLCRSPTKHESKGQSFYCVNMPSESRECSRHPHSPFSGSAITRCYRSRFIIPVTGFRFFFFHFIMICSWNIAQLRSDLPPNVCYCRLFMDIVIWPLVKFIVFILHLAMYFILYLSYTYICMYRNTYLSTAAYR